MSGPYAPTDLTRPATVTTVPPADWWAPEGIAAVAAEQAEVELKPTTTDALQADASPPEYPPGSPRLRPYMRLPRKERKVFFRQLGPIQELMNEKIPKKGADVGGAQAADMYEALEQVEDFLRPLAEDPAAFDAWLAGQGADDVTFIQFMNAYFAGAQLGEAGSSSS